MKHFWVLLLLVVTWLLFNYPIMETIWDHGFDDGTYSHSFLVPFIVIYLMYILEVEQRVSFRSSVSWYWSGVLLSSGIALWIATWSQISLLYWLMSLIVLITLIFQVFKFNISTLFPVAYLIFIFPFWGSLAIVFQNISVFMVTLLMSFTDIPVYVENEFVNIPSGIFEIAEGCSGLRYIIVALAISSLYVFLYLRTAKSAIIFTGFALLGALVTNWVRILLLIIIGHVTEMESSLMTDHNNFGWYIYIPVALAQFYLGSKLESLEAKSAIKSNSTDKEIKPSRYSKSALYSGLIIVGVFSSATAISLIHEEKTDKCDNESTELRPEIAEYLTVCNSSNEDVVRLIYFFNGKDLDSKASYFLNDMHPSDFHLIEQHSNDAWNVEELAGRRGALYLLAYRYKFKSNYYLNFTELKKARLMGALLGETNVEIQWRFTKCEQSCELEDIERVTM
ncbi:exosortase [Alteromonas naphthalenivorans]|uniref:exosortase n=1 Tax=Alteromonas naphthalenivorans TaxID=715451 RepID=UPI0013050F3A|nr:exosortase [Alteromonas naphthalenivorans]